MKRNIVRRRRRLGISGFESTQYRKGREYNDKDNPISYTTHSL